MNRPLAGVILCIVLVFGLVAVTAVLRAHPTDVPATLRALSALVTALLDGLTHPSGTA